ncbi:MAG: NOP5/NOP56 family protein [Candidatus Hodarchaeales archaeon]
MKCVLVITTGVLFGEITNNSAKITQSIPSKQNESILGEKIKYFLGEHDLEFRKMLSDVSEEIISDNAAIVEYLRTAGYENTRFAGPGELFPIRSEIRKYLEENSNFSHSSDVMTSVREQAMLFTQNMLRENVEARDKYIAQAINSIDDINSILNLIYARLSEWYGIHFPELQDLVRDNDQYIKLVAKMEGKIRSEITPDDIVSLSESRQEMIQEAAMNSLGAGISQYDMNPISQLASFGVEILNIKVNLEKYIEESMKEVAPNLQLLVGSLLGARLISLAGNLENLAKRSSGTIQVLGAEKALFRHLRSGEDPPKHGVIFQSPLIHSAKLHQRGKISRALAGKLSIAARVDYFSGEFIAPTLVNDLQKRILEIQKSFPEPTEKQQARKQQKRSQKPSRRRPKSSYRDNRRNDKPWSKKGSKRKHTRRKPKNKPNQTN